MAFTIVSCLRAARRYHRWLVWIVALPLFVSFSTGACLLLRKDVAWIEPREMRGTGHEPLLPLDRILEIAKRAPEARISDWNDIARLDVQPRRALVKVRTTKRWELQIDAGTGKILGSYYRRTGFFAALHDGSIFGEWFPIYVGFPVAVLSLIAWLTGVALLLLPYLV